MSREEAIKILEHISRETYVYENDILNKPTEALKIAIKEMKKINKIKEAIERIVKRNSNYNEKTYKVTDLSTLVIHTEIKGQNELIRILLNILGSDEDE